MGDSFQRITIVLLAAVAPAYSQVVGASLTGTVRDAANGPIPNVIVTVKNVETGAARKLTTDDFGRYSAPSISIGNYEISAEKTGFTSQLKTGIRLSVGQSATVDLTLPVGELQQVITVLESPSPVSLSTQQSSGLVNERQVKELPLNGRSYDELITLNPAIVNYTGERAGGVGTSNSAVGNMFAVSGRRPQENLFLLNGIEYTGNSEINLTPGGASGQLLGVDAVREFNVVTDAYGVEYGKRPGAQVSIVTASGTNQIHGSAYEFLRNNAFDARNFFDQASAPQFQRNEFGGAIGGPIRRDKTFLFGNYEGFRQHLGLSDVTLVPDLNARQGVVGGVNVGVAPGIAPLLNLWPVANGPNLGGGIAEAFSNPLQIVREDFGTMRFDHTFSDRDTLFAVYTVDDSADNTPTINPLSSVVENLREQVVSLQEQHVFSPRLLNTARIGFSRASYFFTGQTPVSLPGWTGSNPIGAVVIGGSTASNGASQISQAGTNVGANLNTARNLFTYDDHVGITHGIHQIEAGVWIQRIQANDNLAQYQWGQASFGSLIAFLQGTVSTFTVIPSPTALEWRSVEGAGFVQDSMKLGPNLTLRIGFRFESTNGWNEAHGRASNYGFDGNGVINTTPTVGSSALAVNRAKFLPEPRAGLAWDPFGKGKTVIHAGFGIYRALLDNLDYRLDANAPFNTTQVFKNIPIANLHSPAAAGLTSPSGVQPDPYTPTAITYTLKVEQQIAPNTSLTVGYVGSHGYHEALSADANEPFPTPGTLTYPRGAPFANPNLANTTTWFTEGISSYNALEIDVNRRFSHGLQFRGVYTFSKSLDDGSAWNTNVGVNAPGFVMYPGNPKLDYGLSTYDVRNLAVINATYELPFGAHSRLGGWTLSGIASLQSGFPFTPQLGYNPSNNGDSRNPVRPSYNPGFAGQIVPGGPNQYFNPNAFLAPASGTFGNVGRDTLTGPGLATLDFSILKNTKISEKLNLQFRGEFFNILNRANFGTPNPVVFSSASTIPAPTAGLITSTSTTSRQIQFGLKLLW
jgi:Carboxypeptidase regulatory-like domain